jgi:hypothetical protein
MMTSLVDRLEYREGGLYWKDGPRRGRRVGTIDNSNGYRRFNFQGKILYEHRIIWEMLVGEVPNVIDHINQDKTDNRIENLRNCCQTINQTNRKGEADRDNTSGCRGVSWNKSKQRWEAYITLFNKRRRLGYHRNLDEAINARKEYELKYLPA